MTALLAVFLIAALGYLIGGIKIKGIELGTAGVLLVALVFGHFFGKGVMLDLAANKAGFKMVQNLGLSCFVGAVGFIAGPKFFRDFKKNAGSYILLGFVIILSGALVSVLTIKLFSVSAESFSRAWRTVMSLSWAMFIPPTVTARLSLLSRLPLQSGHGILAMYSSISCFI